MIFVLKLGVLTINMLLVIGWLYNHVTFNNWDFVIIIFLFFCTVTSWKIELYSVICILILYFGLTIVVRNYHLLLNTLSPFELG